MKKPILAVASFRLGRRVQAGASLLEVLIAIVIMSFGLLAMGGLAATSLQYGKMAQFQTVAVQLASDYADRMRSNTDGYTGNFYDKTTAYTSATSSITVPSCGTPTKCTPQELANIDKAEWRNALRTGLPGGDAYVLRDVDNPLAVDVWVMWIDPSLASGTDTSMITSGSASCPSAAVPTGTTVPHCLYFRAAI